MRKLKLFNSLGQKKQVFKPEGETVDMYVCGITPDGVAHLGHAFLFVSFDVFVRYLKHIGYKTKYVQNLTDVNDDMFPRAKKAGKNWIEFGEENTQIFLDDMQWLNNEQPDCYPKATDHVTEMIEINKKLIKKGMAYESNGNVYFDYKKDKNYGKLSRLSKKEMFDIANERGNFPNDPNKRDPMDFILWQVSLKGEPSWDSPWGKGRPGWHIECSAMAMKYLGETIDVQSGGADLIFPHHESSIAQSEYSTGKQFAKFWMHIGMLCYKGEKMAKSLGNFVSIQDFLHEHSARLLRFLVLKTHYLSPLDYSENLLLQAERELGRIDKFRDRMDSLRKTTARKKSSEAAQLLKQMRKETGEALEDDFNTPKALAALFEGIRKAHALADKESISSKEAALFLEYLQELDRFFCFLFQKRSMQGVVPSAIQQLAERREQHRRRKEWQAADKIREDLQKQGWQVEDTPKGPKVKRLFAQ